MLVLREKTNHISIWIFIINVMKGVSLSTHLKVVFYMKRWIPPTSCSFQLTQRWCAPTRRTNVYRDWFRDSGTQLHSGHSLPDRSITFCSSGHLGVGMWKQSWLKCFNLNIPLFLIRTNFRKEIKKALLTQTLHRKTLKLLRKIKKIFRLQWATNLASLCKLLRSYFVTIIRTLYDSKRGLY